MTPTPEAAEKPAPQVAGLSLAHYAAVRAAVAEGFPLAEVLAVEGLRPRSFARADLAWKQRLASDAGVLAAYEAELAQAEDWLDRTVDPLAEDAAAWAGFLGAFAQHPQPFELLQSKDLGMNDISRLRRRWIRRAEGDARLAERLAKLCEKPPPLAAIRVAARVLRPSRMAIARPPEKERAPLGPIEEPELGLVEYAALCAELAAMPEQRARALRRHGVDDEEAFAKIERQWRLKMEREPQWKKDFERLRAHHGRRVEALLKRAQDAPAVAEPAAEPAARRWWMAPKPLVPALMETAPSRDAPPGLALPFVAGSSALARASPEAAASAKAPSPALGETAPSRDVPPGLALPFVAPAPPLEEVLSLDRYAALCVELSVHPEEAEAIFERYGLGSAEKRAAIDEAWMDRLHGDPEEYEAWQELYRRHDAVMRPGRR